MIATIIAGTCIAAYASFCIWHMVRTHNMEKKSGIPGGCYSCASYKAGSCSHHCGSVS